MAPTEDVIPENIKNFLRLQYVIFKIATEVVRVKFCEEWKLRFKKDWNSEKDGKKFTEGIGKLVYTTSKPIQKNALKSGNINLWDLPLIIQSIKCLKYNPNTKGKSCKSVCDEYKKLDELKEIRNKLSHQPTSEVSQDDFQKYWEATIRVLLSFGVTQERLDEAKHLKYADLPTISEYLTRINEENTKKAEELKKVGDTYCTAEKYKEACNVFSEAMQLPEIPLELLTTLYSKRSLMHFKLNDFSNAKDDAKGVIHLNPSWWNGYDRLGSAYEKMKKYQKAIKNYEIVLQMNPPDLNAKIVTDSLYYCRRILGKLNRMDGLQPHNFINSINEAVVKANKKLGLNGTIYEGLGHLGFKLGLEVSEDNSDPVPCSLQGHCYLRGVGKPQDFEAAANRLAKAASKGSADGMYNLGCLLLEGMGIKRNTRRGIEMLEQAAAQQSFIVEGNLELKNEGVSEAKHALGLAYYEGSGVPQNLQTAFSWWSRAVEEDGNGASANNIGIMYEEGEFVRQDIETSILYWKFAAWDDLTRAMENLYRAYVDRKNYIGASYWYRLSIEEGAIKSSSMEKIMSASHGCGDIDSKLFKEKLSNELKRSRFRTIVQRCEDATKNLAQQIKGANYIKHIVYPVSKSDADFIVDHRKYFRDMRQSYCIYTNVHPAKLQGKPNVDIFGLKPIYFKEMIGSVEKIYEGYAIKVLIIDDAIVGQPSVNIIGQDTNGTIQRIFIYNIPQNSETQDMVGYGCTLTIVNPYHKIGAFDGRPMIRVDDPSTILYHAALTNKKRCRYCGNPQGTILCGKCKRCYYCSQNCLTLDANERQHTLVCVKNL